MECPEEECIPGPSLDLRQDVIPVLSGYLVGAYLLTGAAFGAYLLSLARRRRSLERRMGRAGGSDASTGLEGDGAPRG